MPIYTFSTNFGVNGVLMNLASDFTGYLVGLASSADGASCSLFLWWQDLHLAIRRSFPIEPHTLVSKPRALLDHSFNNISCKESPA